MSVECHANAEGVDSPIQGFAGPIILTGRWGGHNDVVLVEFWGSGAPVQEG
jgi:hypothetical protein